MLNSPLEQFEIISLISLIKTTNFTLAITNATIFLIINITLLTIFLHLLNINLKIIPTRWQSFFEEIIFFIKNLVHQNIGNKGMIYIPFILFLFIFILLSNFIGMIPYSLFGIWFSW
jgi:F0F1-type ATP synthase membrane subunit a